MTSERTAAEVEQDDDGGPMTAERLQKIHDAHYARLAEARAEMTAEPMTAERMKELDLLHEAREAVYAERHELFDHLFREVVNPDKARAALDAFVRRVSSSSRDEYAEYVRQVRASPRWEDVAKHLPPGACCELFEILLWSWGGYAALRYSHTLTGEQAQKAAATLLHEVEHSAGTPGLTQAQRDTLEDLLRLVVEGGTAELSDGGKAIPPRSDNPTAVRSYLLRRIIIHIRKHTSAPLNAVIADLANEVLTTPDNLTLFVDAQGVRDARRLLGGSN